MIGQTISHYKISEKLGQGGMGVVYKAEDTKLKRTVALKFLPPDLTRDPEAKQRFIHEAQAASALEHNNICNIHEIDETDDGQTFIVMACYEGEILKDKIQKGPLKVEQAIDITIQVAEGLKKAHKTGIVHRDIKPANIFIADDGIVKILDFGLAKLAGQVKLTKTGTTIGTVAYMAPEQARGEKIDQRTDIWSLGVVLYEMLSGQLPFKSEYVQALVYSILNEDPEPIKNLRPSVPMELERIIAKTLAKSSDERYQHINDVLVDLRKLKKELESIISEELPSKKKPRPSIAVLPFTNLSADKEQEFFCDGMAEEIINALTHVEGLRVVARTSAFVFKDKCEDIREIGKKLNVETLLEGSVRKAGNRLRISAQLINVADGYHLWSEKYDRDMEDIFAVQDEISLAIVAKLKVRLLGEERAAIMKRHTEDVEAHNFYLQGRYFWNKRTKGGLKKAIEYFKLAAEKDPDYALAYAGLADVYNVLPGYWILSREEAYPKAKEAALRALELDDRLAEAHTSLADVKYNFENDLEGAEQEFKRAMALNPGYATAHHWYSIFLRHMDRFEEAVKEGKHALELDPLSPVLNFYLAGLKERLWDWAGAEELCKRCLDIDPSNGTRHAQYALFLIKQGRTKQGLSEMNRALELGPDSAIVNSLHGIILYYRRQYNRAVAQLQKTIKMAPFSGFSHTGLGAAYLEKQMYAQALAEFQKGMELSREDPEIFPIIKSLQGVTYSRMRKKAEALAILDDLIERSKQIYVDKSLIALIYFALGENDLGFQWLQKAYEQHAGWLTSLLVNPLFDSARSDPRFTALLKKMGLEK
jgi:serine/threonine protein kinase/Tfp pilus assembly protein PilF